MAEPEDDSQAHPSDGEKLDETDEDDSVEVSPTEETRKSVEEGEKEALEARQAMEERARAMQASLLALVDRVEAVKSEHDKLDSENKFLQSYIGELMSTSKIISTGAAKGKGKGGRSK
ncbi:MAG: hypothetical protein M1832_000981 [Thelocarpon impressellum]|nr:MAG: hypothetical protein M1832_000981 [Thelocarpon impressellum]